MSLLWLYDEKTIDWNEMSDLYRLAPLGEKDPQQLKEVYKNSRFKCLVFDGARLVGVGRALADGCDCSYICDVAVHPSHQGTGLGRAIINKLRELSVGHKKIILYAKPGKQGFYQKMGFKKMATAMAIFEDQDYAENIGLIESSSGKPPRAKG
ncbi:GNAT family N-acetyltransferase [Agaribacterium haliotis]|uniref:GNAT family N-acetyltransferase n=1 Tax=Agaribacterium haliotis TaxID=2013869 RepID=UPI000BB53DEC|nr:GNAT family N-acetyltransferase [Agaribacterium haliotis]